MQSDYQENDKKWSVRPAVSDDLSQIMAIEKKAHLYPWLEEHFQEEWKKPYSHTWVLTDDETDTLVAGYLVFWNLSSDWELLNLAVSLDFRGLGFGKYLLQRWIQKGFSDMAESLFLNVRKGNLPAIRLYQAQGFQTEVVRQRFYSDGEDAYQMRLACMKTPSVV